MYIYWAGWGLVAMCAYSFWGRSFMNSEPAKLVPQLTVTREDHRYCTRTGFCMQCGAHKEVIEYDNLLCMYSTNTRVISHIRAEKILDAKLHKVMDDVSKEKPTV
jgi:hypothetical protein